MSRFVRHNEIRRDTLEWGEIGWRCAPLETGARQIVVMDVSLASGQGHDFHRHPDQEELIIVKSGTVDQWLEQEHAALGPGDSVYIDRGVVHASFNDGSKTAELQVVIGPAIGEGGYVVEDVAALEPWSSLRAGRPSGLR
jgi:quercetin dioxygenase-like cupin family protein